MTARRILVSLLTSDPADLNLARRKVAHDRLVLLVPSGGEQVAEAIRHSEAEVGAPDLVEIVGVDGHDARQHLALVETILDRHRTDAVVVNAAGGDAALMAAVLYAAYARGVETWFFQEGRSERLPILRGLELSDRVDAVEAKVLVALAEEGETSRHLAETLVVPRRRIELACQRLRRKGLIVLTAHDGLAWATRTAAGDYVREHLVARTEVVQDRA